jgi:hypothetical protein
MTCINYKRHKEIEGPNLKVLKDLIERQQKVTTILRVLLKGTQLRYRKSTIWKQPDI